MNRPSKPELLTALRACARAVLDAVRAGHEIPNDAIEAADSVGWQATYVAERLEVTGRDYVPPDAAQQLFDLAHALNNVADSISNAVAAESIRRPATALNDFLARYAPSQTESGKFTFRLDEE